MFCYSFLVFFNKIPRAKVTTIVDPSDDDEIASYLLHIRSLNAALHYPIEDARINLGLDQPALLDMQALHKHAEGLARIRYAVDASIQLQHTLRSNPSFSPQPPTKVFDSFQAIYL
jgi:hypothetical protein